MDYSKINVNTANVFRVVIGQNLLKDGASVQVRILSSNGNGKYLASVGGQKCNITAKNDLSAGDVFKAEVRVIDNKIELIPEMKNESVIKAEMVQNQNLSVLLQNLGIIPDNLSIHIYKQFIQMQEKINPELMEKIKNIAIKFGGNEKKASEILMILKDKGINASEEEIQALITFLENNHLPEDNSNKNTKFELLNKINSTKGKWYILPFNIVSNELNTVLGNGNIKLFFQNQEKLTQLNIDCKYLDDEFLFNLYFENNLVNLVRMNIQNKKVNPQAEINKIKSLFAEINPKLMVEWTEKENLEGTGCELENTFSVEGLI